MSHFTTWKVSQVSKSSMLYDNVRAPRERRKENKKEDLPEDQLPPHSQMLQKGEGAQTVDGKTKETGDNKAAEEGPSLGKTDPRQDAKGTDWKTPLRPVYPPLVSSPRSTKAVGRSWELSPPAAKSFRMYDVHMAHLPQQGPFRHSVDMKAEKRLAGRKERRSRFGDINTHKCYQFGQIFCPFQALATTVSKLLFCTRLGLEGELSADGLSCVQKHGQFQRRKRSGERGYFCDRGRWFWFLSFYLTCYPLRPVLITLFLATTAQHGSEGHQAHSQVPSQVAVVTTVMASCLYYSSVPRQAEDFMQKGRLRMGANEGFTSVLPHLGIVFSFTRGVAFHPDASRGHAPDN
ncbi:uncharacterized protein LOC130839656 [Hippopotamus amphibius kiboko]|uniref:uncharacterized protein LOC130839656 n=1 Tax=Hippopotamus amphibius kiboko TaxID=575201 RepID=UPI002598211E|nr:uncharacterized protein LOC130839656 [Hippopotamus amphibius kiboko]